MDSHLPVCFASLLLASFAATLPAQVASRIVPARAITREGDTASVYPFAQLQAHVQHIWRGTAITASAGSIQSLRFRRDGVENAAYPKLDFSRMTIQLGTTTVLPEKMSSTFAQNVTSKLTQVFQGRYSAPPLPASTSGLPKFNVPLVWQTPFAFDPKKGHLVMDLVTTLGSSKPFPYRLDADIFGNGHTRVFGTSGRFKKPEAPFLGVSNLDLFPGGSLAIRGGIFSQRYPATLIFGVSDKTFAGQKLPLDLAPLGAPGNFLYASMDVLSGFPYRGLLNRWIPEVRFKIPNDSRLFALRFFVQAYFADPGANALGLVASNGVSVELPLSGQKPWGHMIANPDVNAPFGVISLGGFPAGLVTEFRGSLK